MRFTLAQDPQFIQLGAGDPAPGPPVRLVADTTGTTPVATTTDSTREDVPADVAAVLRKKYPTTAADLRVIQDRVKEVLSSTLPATVGVELGEWSGSGVIVSPEGLVLTAGHVAGRSNESASLVFADGRRARGKVLGINQELDCGMMQITEPAGPWPYMPLAEPGLLKTGDWVIATGQPGGYDRRRTPPVRLGRVLTMNDELITTDCTLVGGDSGGPLVDLRGQLVGIHSRIGEKLTANFHVPVAAYQRDWSRLVAGEMWGDRLPADERSPSHPILGIAGRDVDGQVQITQVFANMPAEQAGIRPGDVLVRFDDQPIESFGQLSKLVESKRPGQKVSVTVRRGDQQRLVHVHLAASVMPLPGGP